MFSKKLLIFIAIFIFLLSPLIVWGAYGLKETATAAKLTTTAPGDLPTLIGSILGTGLSLVGILFFALMLYGGLTWMLARGNAEQEKQALNTITAAIIGIVIVLASYAITNFVFTNINPGGGTSSGGGSADGEEEDTTATGKCYLNWPIVTPICVDYKKEECGVVEQPEIAKLCVWGKDVSDSDGCIGNLSVGGDFCATKTKDTVCDATMWCKWTK